ncbi:leucyl aminopeptidase [Candidatus Berkelbacteria bacterium]|nr:leucyl aminopeptidase [Candidatus Berkelbacteria bacterium]
MTVSITTKPLKELTTPALIVPVPKDAERQLPAELEVHFAQAAREQFQGKLGELLMLYPTSGSIERIVLVGLGDGKGTHSGTELFRRAVGTAVKALVGQKVTELSLFMDGILEEQYAMEATYVSLVAPYQYTKHKSSKDEPATAPTSLTLVAPGAKTTSALKAALERAVILADSVRMARDLVNAPSNVMTPKRLAAAAEQLAKATAGVSCTVFGLPELTKRKFGALLAVAQGSHEEPQLITLEYQPGKATKTIALVGKGVTFDTGGINLKPGKAIEGMNMDMAGGGTMLATIIAAARLKLPVHLIAIIPATENMPSGSAVKPGDVVTARSGATIEVADTDAEGRMILADGLDWARQFKPDIVVDAATLTGAALVALGEERAAILGNDAQLLDDLARAGETAGEPTWMLPLDDDYRAHVKSDIADVKNIGKGRNAGVISGAAFLEKFVPKGTPWAHIDLAGPAMRSDATHLGPKGGTAWGVRLLIAWLTAQGRA